MLKVNGQVVELGHFPDGTLLLKDISLDGGKEKWIDSSNIELFKSEVEWKFENNEELVALMFIKRHLDNNGIHLVNLKMSYIPNARQDRVKSSNDVFTLKYFAEIINGLNFSSVEVLDPHSKVSEELINNLVVKTPKHYIEKVITEIGLDGDKDIVFYPDAGAEGRYDGMLGHQCAYGVKVRDWETGQIKGLNVEGVVPEKPFNVLIVDDISSYGGTFYHSAKKLKELGANKIYLFVSHCENSILQGDLIKSGLIKMVYTTDSLFSGEHELITVLK